MAEPGKDAQEDARASSNKDLALGKLRDALMKAARLEAVFIVVYLGFAVFIVGIGVVTLRSVYLLSDSDLFQPLVLGGFILTAATLVPLKALELVVRKYVRMTSLVGDINNYFDQSSVEEANAAMRKNLEERAKKLLEV